MNLHRTGVLVLGGNCKIGDQLQDPVEVFLRCIVNIQCLCIDFGRGHGGGFLWRIGLILLLAGVGKIGAKETAEVTIGVAGRLCEIAGDGVAIEKAGVFVI